MKTIAEIEAEIGVVVNPVDGRIWYRLLGTPFGDWDATCGHYRRTQDDGRLVLIRDDTMTEVLAYPDSPGPLASGWRSVVEDEDGTPIPPTGGSNG